jgi:CheY-like chemotaxis protein
MKPIDKIILLVDDDSNDRNLVTAALDRLNLPNPVRSVHSGFEAVRYLNGEGRYAVRSQFPYPAVIITDLKMADGDGFTLLHDIRAHPQWNVIPTIVLTGSSDKDDVKKAYLLGADTYFTKPARYDDLKRLLRLAYDYWDACETPDADVEGQLLPTQSEGKLGERIPQPEYVPRPRSEGATETDGSNPFN